MTDLFHIARAADWEQAVRDGDYRVSSLGARLEDAGFIHLSFAHQVKFVADHFYLDAGDIVLLRLDPARLTARVVVESGGDSGERFPHLYGPLNLDAVVEVTTLTRGSDGTFPAVTTPAR